MSVGTMQKSILQAETRPQEKDGLLKWTTDFDAMAKTVLKLLLSRWEYYPLICKSNQDDQKVFESDEGTYKDNPETKKKQLTFLW